MDIKEIAVQMRAAVKSYVAKALGPVIEDLKDLRAKLESLPVPKDGRDGKDGENGKDGKDTDPESVARLVKEHVSEALSALPPAPPGAPGKDGADGDSVDMQVVRELVRADVGEAVAKIPPAPPGPPGEDGTPGEKGDTGRSGTDGIDGLPGERGADAADIQVLAEIDEAKVYPRGTFACHKGGMIHATRKTSPITEGLEAAGWQVCMNGIADELEEVGAKGMIKRTTVYTSGAAVVTEIKNGAVTYRGALKDGKPVDLDAIFESRMATLEADFARRSQLAIERMPRPRDGVDGTDGAPGGSIEDFAIEVKDRMLAVGMKIGGKDEVRMIKLDMPIDRGVFQSGKKYEKGDIVTFSGSSFIAQADTADKPEESKSWRLMVKRGRDGKDGKDAEVAA